MVEKVKQSLANALKVGTVRAAHSIFTAEALASDLGTFRLLQDEALQKQLAVTLAQIPACFETLKKIHGQRQPPDQALSKDSLWVKGCLGAYAATEVSLLVSDQAGLAVLLLLLGLFGARLLSMSDASYRQIYQQRVNAHFDTLAQFFARINQSAAKKHFSLQFPD